MLHALTFSAPPTVLVILPLTLSLSQKCKLSASSVLTVMRRNCSSLLSLPLHCLLTVTKLGWPSHSHLPSSLHLLLTVTRRGWSSLIPLSLFLRRLLTVTRRGWPSLIPLSLFLHRLLTVMKRGWPSHSPLPSATSSVDSNETRLALSPSYDSDETTMLPPFLIFFTLLISLSKFFVNNQQMQHNFSPELFDSPTLSPFHSPDLFFITSLFRSHHYYKRVTHPCYYFYY